MRESIFCILWLLCAVALTVPTCETSKSSPTSVDSSPNPIGTSYPTSVTGTINGTIAVVPIPYELARSIIPAQYGILENAYRSLLPDFPEHMYPLIIRSILDHDVGVDGIPLIPDFQSIHVFYPFVDLLGDGYSNFVYEKYLVLTASNALAIEGAEAYGQIIIPATFEPANNAYAYWSRSGNGEESDTIFLNAYTNVSNHAAVATKFKILPSIGPWPFEFYVNITNQPIFSNGIKCDQQITFYNTTLSVGENAAVGLIGDITISTPELPSESAFQDIYGVKVDIAFIENNLLDCSTLKGY